MFLPTHYLHYFNYGDQNNRYNVYNRHNCIKFMYTSPRTLKWCVASESGLNSWNAFPYIRGSYSSKNIAKSRWSVHLRLGRHPQETGGTVFDPQQPLERDATEPHIWPNVYLADALLREPIRIVRAQLEQTVAWPKHADASCSHGTLRPAGSSAAIL